ncbi:hypothetical protein B0H14DRAFT_2847772 [Mycena olivaceomarginata]|nr:hypothetical protein B0H14DRAFT_2847772 [Mycena olivaceomarginata]
MPLAGLTISAATPHVRFTEPKKRAQLSPEDRKDRQEARADKQALIDSAELGTRHKLKPQYFLDLFFQGGARMIHQQKKVNPYTAFKAEKAAECRERGESKKVPELHEEYFDEYKNLTDEEKQDIVDRYTESHASRTLKLRRDTPMVGLASHVGAEGFFCIVRNRTDFHMDPQWYFTSRELEEYMRLRRARDG